MAAIRQLQYLLIELQNMNNTHWWRWLSCWFTTPFITIANYRFSRFFYLLLGPRLFKVFHLLITPCIFLLRPWFKGCEIHYKADIGPGLRVLHPDLGIVVSGFTVAGNNLVLSGGNCLGIESSKALHGHRQVILGDNIHLGANASIIGPLRIGSNVRVGAGAVVVNDAPDNCVLVGIPAKERVKAASENPEAQLA